MFYGSCIFSTIYINIYAYLNFETVAFNILTGLLNFLSLILAEKKSMIDYLLTRNLMENCRLR